MVGFNMHISGNLIQAQIFFTQFVLLSITLKRFVVTSLYTHCATLIGAVEQKTQNLRSKDSMH